MHSSLKNKSIFVVLATVNVVCLFGEQNKTTINTRLQIHEWKGPHCWQCTFRCTTHYEPSVAKLSLLLCVVGELKFVCLKFTYRYAELRESPNSLCSLIIVLNFTRDSIYIIRAKNKQQSDQWSSKIRLFESVRLLWATIALLNNDCCLAHE